MDRLRHGVSRLDGETDGGSIFPVDHDVGERGSAHDFDAYRREETARDGDRLYRLVDGSCADRLNLDVGTILDHARNGARNRSGRRFR